MGEVSGSSCWKKGIPLCLAVALLLLAGWLTTAFSASATGSASVQIMNPLNLVSVAQLDFGRVGANSAAGEGRENGESLEFRKSLGRSGAVVVTPQNQRNVVGNVKVEGAFHRAEFRVTGPPNISYTIQVEKSVAIHSQSSSQKSGVTLLQLVDIRSFSVNSGGEGFRGATNTQGEDTIYVGATLLISPSAQEGRYTGDVRITLSY